MNAKLLNTIWFFIFLFLAAEYYFLNFNPSMSIFLALQKKGLIQQSTLIVPTPGRPLSLWLGWLGLGLMILMNVYSVRKRAGFMQNWGRLSSWLNFHVFCGLLGPTMIMFHCNFKVRGIVAISFWSMVVSFSSGIIGRYFYVQMLKAKVDFEKESEKRMKQLSTVLEKSNIQTVENEIQNSISKALVFVGVPANLEDLNPFNAFYYSMVGDLKLTFSQLVIPPKWPEHTRFILSEIAVQKRRALFLESFQSLMGYWHTFHFPFAVFMYVAAAIHVAAALVFGI